MGAGHRGNIRGQSPGRGKGKKKNQGQLEGAFGEAPGPAPGDAVAARNLQVQRCALLDFFNERIDATWWAPPDVLAETRLLPKERKIDFSGWRQWTRAACHLAKNRREIDLFFNRIEFGFDPKAHDGSETIQEKHQNDPLTQWLLRAAEMDRESFPEGARRFLNGHMPHFPWAPRDILRELGAELTEQVGRLVYYPAIIALILFVSWNRWWDAWPWPVALIFIFAFNMIIAVAGVLILQRTADRARRRSIESLDTKLKLRRRTIESEAKAVYHLGERLLEDLKNIRRGAYAPFWQNPAIGAVLVPSGGIALIEVLMRFWVP